MTRHIEPSTLDESIREALRFLHAAQTLRAARKAAKSGKPQKEFSEFTSKENASCWRASMDLADKLAELRAGK